MSGPLSGPDDMKSSTDRQTRTPLEHHRQAQDRLGSMERADDGRRGHKTGTSESRLKSVAMQTDKQSCEAVLLHTSGSLTLC